MQVADILGVEIYECVRWRQGALLYMLCSIINEDDNRRERNKDCFLQVIFYLLENQVTFNGYMVNISSLFVLDITYWIKH